MTENSVGRRAPVTDTMDDTTPRRARPRPPGRVTVADVARAAGVSTASVSRVLNNSGRVADALRQRVIEASESLGYLPDAAARALASDHSQTIGAIIPTLENRSFAICVDGLQRRLDAAGYTLLLANSAYDPDKELRAVKELIGRGVDGLMLVGALRDPKIYDLLRSKGVPFVNTFTLTNDAQRPCVGFDNRAAARRMAEYLLDLGHREFGIIAGVTRDNDRALARLAGVRDALTERGLALPQERLIERPYRIVEGQYGLRALLACRRRPSVVVCGNDVLAFGALIEAQAAGIPVPDQLSVAGFDDVDFAAHLNPPLTTVRVPLDDIGARAGDFLVARIQGRAAPVINEVPSSLIVRGSTSVPAPP